MSDSEKSPLAGMFNDLGIDPGSVHAVQEVRRSRQKISDGDLDLVILTQVHHGGKTTPFIGATVSEVLEALPDPEAVSISIQFEGGWRANVENGLSYEKLLELESP